MPADTGTPSAHTRSRDAVYDAIARLSVLVVGDVMLDEHLWGSTDGQVLEAGAPTVRVERTQLGLGGAGNAAANAAGLGARTHLVAAIGADEAGAAIRDLTEQVGIETSFVSTAMRPTTRKSRVHAQGRQLVRFDREDDAPIPPSDAARLLRLGLDLVGVVDVVVVSDYAKGTVTADIAQGLVAAARRRDVPVVVDTKCRHVSGYRGCTAITPQVRELASWAGRSLARHDLSAAARALARDLDCQLVLVTESEDGMTLFSGDTSWRLPARSRDVVSDLGAGDTVVATFALGIAAGLPPLAAAALANDAAGVVVQQPGTHAVSRAALVP